MRAVALVFVCLALVGCKAGNWKTGKTAGQTAAAEQRPRLQASADATDGMDDGVSFDVDEKSGRPRPILVLRLDYFPEPKPGSANLPTCYAPFAPDFELGIAVCESRPELKQQVFARNVDQDCYTDPNDQRTAAPTPLLMPGCKRGRLVVSKFEPVLRVDLELRDVN